MTIKNLSIFSKVLSLIAIMGIGFSLSACNATQDSDEDPAAIDATLTDLTLNDITVEGFDAETNDYTVVLPSGVTVVPTVATVKHTADSVVTIDNVINIDSATASDRTMTISVATKDGSITNVYTILFDLSVVQENLDATLTDLTIDGVSLMGFDPEITDYALVLSSGEASTPTVVATKYSTDATVIIDDAVDVESNQISDRTTTITVTSADESATTIYQIVFESPIMPVDLRSADNFVALAESGISTATSSVITGDIGLSPAAATYITGFSLIMDSTNEFATSSQITGNAYASDYTIPTGSVLTTAISDMHTAYIDAAGRAANYNELYAGDLSGKTLTTGVYSFGNSVLINTDLTLDGSATDVFIFQISGQLTQAAGINITLTGGVLAENVVWQVADTVSVGSGAHFEGTILAMTNISFNTNASINGSLYAQTAITLDACVVTKP